MEREERGLAVAELERLSEVPGPEVASLRAMVSEIKDMPVPQVVGSDTAALAAFSPWQRIQEAPSLIRHNQQQPKDAPLDAAPANEALESGRGAEGDDPAGDS